MFFEQDVSQKPEHERQHHGQRQVGHGHVCGPGLEFEVGRRHTGKGERRSRKQEGRLTHHGFGRRVVGCGLPRTGFHRSDSLAHRSFRNPKGEAADVGHETSRGDSSPVVSCLRNSEFSI